MRRRPVLAMLLGLGVLAAGAAALLLSRRTPPPNILLLSADSLRADRLGIYGYAGRTSPALDRFAQRALVFPAAYAPRGETAASITSLLTGLYPSSHGVLDNACVLRETIETLPAALARTHESAAIVANGAFRFCKSYRHFGSIAFTNREGQEQWEDDDEAIAAARAFLARERRGPFFLWVHLMDPHNPYAAGPPERGSLAAAAGPIDGGRATLDALTQSELPLDPAERAQVAALYDEEVAGSDRRLGQLLDTLDELDLWRTTIVVVFADHGEELGDHHKYFYHAQSVYRQVLHVPLLAALPPGLDLGGPALPPGTRLPPTPVSLVDLGPTLAALAGARFSRATEGLDLRPLLRGETPARDAVFTEYEDKIYGILTARHHAIDNPDGFTPWGGPFLNPQMHPAAPRFTVKRRELYDIAADPLEQTDLAPREPELFEELAGRIRAHAASRPGLEPLRQSGDEAYRQLEDAGYTHRRHRDKPR